MRVWPGHSMVALRRLLALVLCLQSEEACMWFFNRQAVCTKQELSIISATALPKNDDFSCSSIQRVIDIPSPTGRQQ